MDAGRIDHAIFATVQLHVGALGVPGPSRHQRGAVQHASMSPSQDAPPLGARIWLDLPARSIERLDVPNWQKTILLAMHRYGMIVGDTMSGHSSWGLIGESGSSYTSFGRPDPWAPFAARVTSARSARGLLAELR